MVSSKGRRVKKGEPTHAADAVIRMGKVIIVIADFILGGILKLVNDPESEWLTRAGLYTRPL